MDDKSQWDWNPGQRVIADMAPWRSEFNWIEEPQVSPDGEKIAAIVNQSEGEFTVCVTNQNFATGGTGRIAEAFELKGSKNIRIYTIAILF